MFAGVCQELLEARSSDACSPLERGWLLSPAILWRIFLPTRPGYRGTVASC
jgi:hypothetical protein